MGLNKEAVTQGRKHKQPGTDVYNFERSLLNKLFFTTYKIGFTKKFNKLKLVLYVVEIERIGRECYHSNKRTTSLMAM